MTSHIDAADLDTLDAGYNVSTFDLDLSDRIPLITLDQVERARLTIADRAHGPAETRALLDMLGILPAQVAADPVRFEQAGGAL